jgi:hypothetical protein
MPRRKKRAEFPAVGSVWRDADFAPLADDWFADTVWPTSMPGLLLYLAERLDRVCGMPRVLSDLVGHYIWMPLTVGYIVEARGMAPYSLAFLVERGYSDQRFDRWELGRILKLSDETTVVPKCVRTCNTHRCICIAALDRFYGRNAPGFWINLSRDHRAVRIRSMMKLKIWRRKLGQLRTGDLIDLNFRNQVGNDRNDHNEPDDWRVVEVIDNTPAKRTLTVCWTVKDNSGDFNRTVVFEGEPMQINIKLASVSYDSTDIAPYRTRATFISPFDPNIKQ